MEAIPGTEFEKSVNLLGQTPDEFAGVSNKDAVFSFTLNFGLDPLRQAFIKDIANLERALLKKEIADGEKRTPEEKAADGDLVDLLCDVVEGASKLGIANAFIRSWRNSDGRLSTVAGGRIAPRCAGEVRCSMLDDIASRSPDNKVDKKVETEEEIEIHKLTVPRLHTELPELVANDGAIYVGTHEKTVWLASGEKALELLKNAIQEAKAAGPKPGPDLDWSIKLGPCLEVYDSYRLRNPLTVAPAGKSDDGKKKTKKVEGLISGTDLRKLALAAFKQGKDTVTMSIHREEKVVKAKLKLDEGCLRFVGKVLSKFVKENLEDE